MTLRSGHGNGAGVPRVEVLPPDEQPFAAADRAAPLVVRDAGGRVVDSASARAMASLPRRGAFLPRDVASHADFVPHDRRRRVWLRRRRAELYTATGGVSYGVGAMLASAAWLYAGGEFCAERAAVSADPEMFRQAASLTATARQHDLAAWELAVREQQARPQGDSVEAMRARILGGGK